MSDLKAQITEQMKDAMRAKDKARLGTIRLILSDIKRIEVDERIELDDARVLQVLDKMVKQRRDSIAQYLAAERPELADKEQQELEVIKTFLPQPLSDVEINAILDEAIAATGASSMADMGKLMGAVKPKLQGRADMGAVSALVKAKLA
ncbi:Transamidase GatB domain protein [Marinobacterium lacunae]|uniref:Transamidase GatB domain protein n=1 Tax=Marinobacterium lacunae TaxID=1232683 RepID=A0A081G0A2_9GAMM|nr:GatB/YqeY domain-containing protein [Marinobacterium lacunae]KEA64207.1 Transamidase GatB domain protein [Marinobacterium lacunae]MBR9885898.1 GatB/YqeY domain-containing protein [Oceanospirillales bacterium]